MSGHHLWCIIGSMAKQKKQYYVVVDGERVWLFRTWNEAKPHCVGQKGVKFKGFADANDALAWLTQFPDAQTDAVREVLTPLTGQSKKRVDSTLQAEPKIPPDTVVMYSDGGSLGNPGPGGYGVVLQFNEQYKEFSGGYRRTTNNRMELMGCITGLEALKRQSTVLIYTDSSYVVNGIEKGWAEKWRSLGWKRSKNGAAAKNADLWARLLTAVDKHDVTFHWVKGHAGNPRNERCDQLAKQAARRDDLPDDKGFTR